MIYIVRLEKESISKYFPVFYIAFPAKWWLKPYTSFLCHSAPTSGGARQRIPCVKLVKTMTNHIHQHPVLHDEDEILGAKS